MTLSRRIRADNDTRNIWMCRSNSRDGSQPEYAAWLYKQNT